MQKVYNIGRVTYVVSTDRIGDKACDTLDVALSQTLMDLMSAEDYDCKNACAKIHTLI